MASEAPRIALIGHRGTGKSSLLPRLEGYCREAGTAALIFDLDSEIERSEGRPIPEIFSRSGEEAFREIERRVFRELAQRNSGHPGPVIVAAGAGFAPAETSGWEFIWVRRPTDSQGRIFLDRPRLNPAVAPLDEFRERYEARSARYRKLASRVLCLQEGFDFPNRAEKSWFLDPFLDLGNAAISVSGEPVEALRSRAGWKLRYFELRDDLNSPERILEALLVLPREKVLVSFREPSVTDAVRSIVAERGLAFDWPVEWGDCPWGVPRVHSLHRKGASLDEAIAEIDRASQGSPAGSVAKLAVRIDTFEELARGHDWFKEKPDSRVFLPSSPSGRWRWYRLVMGGRMPFAFVRESEGTAPDQPFVLEWLRRVECPKSEFAAILGDPVEHSRTPAEQFEFFRDRGLSVVPISVSREEWEVALPRLKDLGLRHAAVTSPLKEAAFESSFSSDPTTAELKAANTLTWDSRMSRWRSTNTDLAGLELAIASLSGFPRDGKVAIWGGGGTLEVVRKVLPQAVAYSAQTGQPREGAPELPGALIWAVGRKNWEKSRRFPPEEWRPSWIVDLNYAEDSPGLEYAKHCGAKYVSGLPMFRAQAREQREFWKNSTD